MKIHLHNFNNLKDLTYELENKKVNFLFGISGSGKSTISKSLNATDFSSYLTAGFPEGSCSVSFEDKVFGENEIVPIYDYDYMNNVLIQKNNKDDIYSILFDGEESLDIYRNKYNEYLGDFRAYKDQLILIKGKIHALIRELKIGFNRDGTYKSTCLVRKLEGTITSKGKNTLAHKYAGERTRWFLEGTNTLDYEEGKCPFCSKILSDKRKQIIQSIISIDTKSFEKIANQSTVFMELNIELPIWNSKSSTNKFRKKLHDIIDAEEEIDTLIQTIDASYKTEFEVSSISRIKISKKVIELFPALNNAVQTFNMSINEIKRLLGKIKSKTISLISKNIECINNYLKRFSIPYTFVKSTIDYDNHVAEYFLKHEDDSLLLDRTNNLSFGEKNIIGLILFVLTNKNKKMIIIDDPASSFDNYRRKIILDLIFEMKQSDSTVLVLSHDEVFIKLALYFAHGAKNKKIKKADMSEVEKKYSLEIGKTTFIENNEAADLHEITINDFDFLDCFIKKRLSELPREINYQTALLIRLLLENIKRKTNDERIAYDYLSAIIHKTDYFEIQNLVSHTGYSENKVLKCINDIVGCSYGLLSSNYLEDYKSFDYNDLEYVVLFRELLKDSKDRQKRAIKTELNSVIHLSSTYITCLDPFKFKMYSKRTHEFLRIEKEKWLNS